MFTEDDRRTLKIVKEVYSMSEDEVRRVLRENEEQNENPERNQPLE